MKKIFKINRAGQSLIEIIIAMAIFSLLASVMITLTLGSYSGLLRGGNQLKAETLANEAVEAMKSVRETGWNTLTNSPGILDDSGSHWVLNAGVSELIDSKFTRTITLDDVCRDVSDNIASCPASYTDLHTKKSTVNVAWTENNGVVNSVDRIAYITNWDSDDWAQTDWSGGDGQSVWSDETMYDSDDGNVDISTAGEIKLTSLVGGQNDWTFDNAPDYTYNAGAISVSGGAAQLVDQGTGGSCSGTAAACTNFGVQAACLAQGGCAWGGGASGASPTWSTTWGTYADWESGGNVSGARPTTGGNPTNYINIAITRNNAAQTSSGYWRQSFTTSVANPETANLNFHWRIPSYNGTFLTSYIIYVFVDNFAGAPTIGQQVWSQTITGTTAWAAVSNLNVSSKLTAAGTYYIKLVARRIKTAGTPPNTNNTVGFDNVSLNWTKNNSCSGTATACNTYGAQLNCTAQSGCLWTSVPSYPTNNPTINPTSAYVGAGVTSWTSFVETATKNGGEIYYQLSNNDGVTWQYWNGGTWAVAGLGNYNTASVVNTNIADFPVNASHVLFKAFLSSDGSQQVVLDNVRIGWGGAGGDFSTFGYFISSAFDMANISPVQTIEWDENMNGCATCDIQMQLRTAPDAGGSPGVWTNWYGASGADTFFTNSSGSLVSSVLNGNQWVQYLAELSGDGNATPILNEVRVNYK